MEIVVNDTNLFFDLLTVDLIDSFFRLPLEVHTTDFVISEIQEPEQLTIIEQFIEDGRLTVYVSEFEEYMQIAELNNSLRGLSMPDCSVWYYSKMNDYTLLTGDKLLRNSALKDNVKVRGVLFVLDLMVETKLLSPVDAADKLQQLLVSGSRLPENECKARLKKWNAK